MPDLFFYRDPEEVEKEKKKHGREQRRKLLKFPNRNGLEMLAWVSKTSENGLLKFLSEVLLCQLVVLHQLPSSPLPLKTGLFPRWRTGLLNSQLLPQELKLQPQD